MDFAFYILFIVLWLTKRWELYDESWPDRHRKENPSSCPLLLFVGTPSALGYKKSFSIENILLVRIQVSLNTFDMITIYFHILDVCRTWVCKTSLSFSSVIFFSNWPCYRGSLSLCNITLSGCVFVFVSLFRNVSSLFRITYITSFPCHVIVIWMVLYDKKKTTYKYTKDKNLVLNQYTLFDSSRFSCGSSSVKTCANKQLLLEEK